MANAIWRWKVEKSILKTAPITTLSGVKSDSADASVHMLVWGRDYLAALWAAKSFYSTSGVQWPLYWHQGGELSDQQKLQLKAHFPGSVVIDSAAADLTVEELLKKKSLKNLANARRHSIMLRKFCDPFVMSTSQYKLLLDSDVLFFEQPIEIIDAVRDQVEESLFNRDSNSWYNVSAQEAMSFFGVKLIPNINAGLGLVNNKGIDFSWADELLETIQLMQEPWLVEQTLHALMGSRYGMKFLSDRYAVSTSPGLKAPDGKELTAKHYPSHPRPLFYQEGIPRLLQRKVLTVDSIPT